MLKDLSKKFKQKAKTYRQKWHNTHKQHEQMILYIKLLIVFGMVIMAAMYRYTDFIKEHQDLFLLEITVYVSCTLAAYVFLTFMRNQSFLSLDFGMGLLKWVGATIFIASMAELAGMNTIFMHEDHTPNSSLEPENKYREKGIDFKESLWVKMIIAINLTFIIGLSLYHLKQNDRLSFILLLLGGLVAVLSIWNPYVKKIHLGLKTGGWINEEHNVSDNQLSMAIFYSVLFVGFTFIVLILSLFRYDSFKIYSYFADNTSMCGIKRQLSTFIIFGLEALTMAVLFSVPLLYVSNNRNKPELGHEYKFIKDKEAFVEFGLLALKIFIIWIALQMTGFFDGYNTNFCRTKDGCNISIGPNQLGKQCVMSVSQQAQQ